MNNPTEVTVPLKSAGTGRLAGGVLLVSSLLTIVAMAHHPTGHSTGIGASGMTLGGFIHGSMIVLLVANFWALIIFSVRRSFDGWMLAGLIAYGIGVLANLTAAMTNGFIVPSLAQAVDHAVSGDVFAMLWRSNQAYATLGVYATSAAFLAWSASLISHKTTSDMTVGTLGALAAVVSASALYAGAVSLNVQGAQLVYSVHAAFTGLIGIQMLRRAL